MATSGLGISLGSLKELRKLGYR